MTLGAYYNEIDKHAAAWLRSLIQDGMIPPGDVDERSIVDVQPHDLIGYSQHHFFAGIGGWPYALRLAGWPDDWPIWTGSCPCQPWSQAGKQAGANDPRHLWPDFFRLIRTFRPAVVMGEQVAAKAGYGWFDGVRTDLEGEDYACRAVDIPACAVDAPNERSRLYWVAKCDVAHSGRGWLYRTGYGQDAGEAGSMPPETWRERLRAESESHHVTEHVADANCAGRSTWAESGRPGPATGGRLPASHDGRSHVADADRGGRRGQSEDALGRPQQRDAVERADAESDIGAVANATGTRSSGRHGGTIQRKPEPGRTPLKPQRCDGRCAGSGALDNAEGVGWRQGVTEPEFWWERDGAFTCADAPCDVADDHRSVVSRESPARQQPLVQSDARDHGQGDVGHADSAGFEVGGSEPADVGTQRETFERANVRYRNGSFWSDADWIKCHDGKARRTKPGLPLLVDGFPGRVALWRGFGNAINPELAAEVIAAFMETEL